MTRRGINILIAMTLIVAAVPTFGQQAKQKDVDELKRAVETQEESIRQLKERIRELEGGVAPRVVPPAEAPPAAAAETGEPISPAEEIEAMMARKYGRQSPIQYRANFDDKQEAAPRPSDETFDTQFRGYIPIPNTVFLLKFNPKPRLDMMFDSRNSGDDFRFVPAKVPVEHTPQHGGGERFNANGNGSQIRVDMRAPALNSNFRLYYQNDFFGSDTRHFQYRLQHFYGQAYGIVAGFTYGVFEDPDAWPDTLDYEGPNSVIFARRPLLHYTLSLAEHWNMTLGIEDPDSFVDTTGDPDASPRTRAPDGGFNIRWEPGAFGHIQFSTIMRSIGVDGDTLGSDDVFGWGVNLAGSLNVTPRDTAQFWFVYGQGVGGMGNDTSFVNSDAAFDNDGDLVALDYGSAMLALTHKWTPRWRSTATYGYANLENTGMQADDAYDFTHYASVNLVFQIYKRVSIGGEGLYGFHEVKSNDDGDVFRFQMSIIYAPFD